MPFINVFKINIKGKLVTINTNGVNESLENVFVYIQAGNKIDTLGRGRTDKYGDFDVNIPNNDSVYTFKADASSKNIMLLNQEGKKISHLQKSFMTYEYKLLKADILELAEMTEDDDISLSFKKFEESKDNKLLVVEDLIYNLDKYTVEKESEEILNKVVSILKGNDKIKLEIISHTDSQRDDASNLCVEEYV